jgi:NAD(P)-dependent dehydrogenase (short-subunit alcohol dehydrogenase family)
MLNRDKQVALVTGGARGIGRGISEVLADAGWAIVINYRSSAEAAQSLADEVKQNGGAALAIQCDVAQAEDRERLVRQIMDEYGRVDLLVNNAGMAPRQRMDMLQTTEASYDEVMTVNLKGPFFLTQRIANLMIEQERAGTIVNIGSISAYTSSPNRAEYCISKAGMGMMTLLFADRLAEHGIRVYEIRPGIIATDMTSAVKDKYDHLIGEQGLTPIRRWGQPEDVARAVLAVAQQQLPFSTGEIINVDGGFHFRRL